MRLRAALLSLALALPLTASAQDRAHVITHPTLPDRSELDRLNLKVGFSTTIPVDNIKDGVATFQLLDNLLVIQLRSGFVLVYQPETGAPLWTVRPGIAYPKMMLDVAADDRYVFVLRDMRIYAYNRVGGQLEWSFEFPGFPSSPPVSDGDRLYVCLGASGLSAYDLPLRAEQTNVARDGMITSTKPKSAPKVEDKGRFELEQGTTLAGRIKAREARIQALVTGPLQRSPSIAVVESVIPPYRLNSDTLARASSMAVVTSVLPPYKLNSDVQSTPSIVMAKSLMTIDLLSNKVVPPDPITKRWSLPLAVRVTNPPVATSGRVVVASTERAVIGTPKLKAQVSFDIPVSANVSSPMSQHGDILFVGTVDSNLYAIDALHGRVLWRATTDGPVTKAPIVVDRDVFVTTLTKQLYRIARESGDSSWKDSRGFDRPVPEIAAFVAANEQFVYAIDTRGELTVIDRAHGIRLQRLPARNYTMALANDRTDRLYLAANDGSLVCLHDRNQSKPLHYDHKPAAVGSESALTLPAAPEKPRVPIPEKPKTPPPPPAPKPKSEKPKTPDAPKDGKE